MRAKRRLYEAVSQAHEATGLYIYGLYDRVSQFYVSFDIKSDDPERYVVMLERSAYYGALPYANDMEIHLLGSVDDTRGTIKAVEPTLIKRLAIKKAYVHDAPIPEKKEDEVHA